MTLKQAYKIVIKDLKKHDRCKDYAFGCFQCGCGRIAEDLDTIYDLAFNSKPVE